MSRPTERTALLADVALSPSASPSASRRSRKPTRLSLLVAVGTVILSLVLVVRRREPGVVISTQDDWEYDAIVVGGGPSGSVVAKLLSDDPWRRVLLIEAGSATQAELGGTQRIPSQLNANNLTPFDVPFHWSSVANTQVYHWDYPDVNVAKALGGCGIHNAMLYVRALPSDFHRWDMPKWTWQKALEIYLHMEDFDGPESEYHGKNGTVRTSPPSFIDELSYEFVAASEQVGIPRSPDFNAPNGRFGVGFYHFNTRHGVRESAARRFLGPILQDKRENFELLLNSTVQKIVLNEAATKAEGVEIERLDGTRQTIRLAKRGQVIVTGGAINTPKILMMSGLGHSGDLKALKIPVRRHLPRVGMNLQDHPVLAMAFSTPVPREIDLHAELTSYFEATQERHVNVTSYGMMGSAGISAGAFLIPPGKTIPEIQLTFFPRKSEPHVWNSSELNHSAEILFTVALLHPKARNRVILTTENNVDYLPRIVSEVPEQEEEHLRDSDVWKLSWGITVVREIAAALAQKGVLGRELTPGPQIRAMEDLNAWVRNNVFRNSHWVGSASMGPSPDKAVVDNHLRVFGIPNLRVADASVIPYIPNGNVHSSVLMVATHAAELIKEDEQDHE